MKEFLKQKEREKMIEKLIEEYSYYINDSDDEELQTIFENGCFTIGSVKYYKEKGII